MFTTTCQARPARRPCTPGWPGKLSPGDQLGGQPPGDRGLSGRQRCGIGGQRVRELPQGLPAGATASTAVSIIAAGSDGAAADTAATTFSRRQRGHGRPPSS